ncbi:hypothetical protein I7I53_02457 [Histoplasma capsulatum var. duboisii H88]|uniref:Uncharacterized protein n=1 Tax=Ajellomyces capsulatus (strain H88) TaxID=544711 RepID=A0A8A1LLS1_AJEC8|nr:hypothetical protein I7I53_02457 [Histoplasma capsulatum var. duboisii H88]
MVAVVESRACQEERITGRRTLAVPRLLLRVTFIITVQWSKKEHQVKTADSIFNSSPLAGLNNSPIFCNTTGFDTWQNLHRATSFITRTLTSSIAKDLPRQARGPVLNAWNVYPSRAEVGKVFQRSGSNFSGFLPHIILLD